MVSLRPSETIFAAHGLVDISFDLPSLPSSSTNNGIAVPPTTSSGNGLGWTWGRAKLLVANGYPLIVPVEPGTKVHFCLCSHGDPVLSSQFRHRAQILALDTLPLLDSASDLAKFTEETGCHRPRITRTRRIIAWWEDEYGLWLVTNEDDRESMSLREWWSRNMAHEPLGDGEGGPTSSITSSSIPKGMLMYSECCQALLAVVKTLQVSIPFGYSVTRDSSSACTVPSYFCSSP
jgi:hypothetical protein